MSDTEFDLHDAVLETVVADWSGGTVKFVVKGGDDRTTLAVTGVVELQVRRRMPWGPSASINTARWTRPAEKETGKLEIEMQSGDVLQVEAEDVRLDVT